MLHKAGKPKDLVGSYRPFSLSSYLSKLLEKAVGDNLSKFSRKRNDFRKNGDTNDKCLKQLTMVFTKVLQPQVSFLILGKPSNKFGLISFS